MHNVAMSKGPKAAWLRRVAVPVMCGVLALTACSSDDTEPGDDPSADPSTSESPEAGDAYLEVPDGVELTAPGSQLAVGESATVAWTPRKNLIGVLDLKVLKLAEASFKSFSGWQLDKQTRTTKPYFVTVKVTNSGDTDLGKLGVPLYIVDGDNVLVSASTFASSFKPCPSTPLPKKFAPGQTARVCLVYLSPDKGDLTAVSFRPTQEFVPITWEGEVKPYQAPKPKKKSKKG